MNNISNEKIGMDLDQLEVCSFDCYGTLIDWESGILSVFKRLLSSHRKVLSDEQILELYADAESQAEAGGYVKYREVLRKVVQRFGEQLNFTPTSSELNCLTNSLGDWKPFPDTVDSLHALKKRFKLAIISNIDDGLFALSEKCLKVQFDWVITAEQVKSYKPALQNFRVAIEKIGVPVGKVLHIAQSIYHDITPAKAMGLSTVWVNRRKGKEGFGATPAASSEPDLEVEDLRSLVSVLR